MKLRTETEQSSWKQLIEQLPSSLEAVSVAIRKTLATTGLLHLTWPMSLEHYEAIAGHLGAIVWKSDVKVDVERARSQEQLRVMKGRGSIYSPGALLFHTDPIADLVCWYCVEQDEIGGPMLMLDLGDLEEHFSPQDLESLCRVEVWMPSRKSELAPETLTSVQLLSKTHGKYKVFYVPWLLRESYDTGVREVTEKFARYLKKKEETQLITLPIKPRDTIFLDNHRVLHGRRELPTTSKRHLVRFYICAA